ncbi:MAG: preprotein translocase subunit SecY [Candidatus Woesearchaeota archaeon]
MSLIDYIPTVKKPTEKRLSLKTRLGWTLAVLIAFYLLSAIPLFGLSENLLIQAKELAILLGAQFGTLTTLGIGPIVTASIIIQLLAGAKIISLDLSKEEDKRKYERLQRMLTLVMIVVEGAAYVFFGALRPSQDLPPSTYLLFQFLIFIQLAIGSLLIMLMDDLCTLWGIGSGISLFIVAGVAHQAFTKIFNVFPYQAEVPSGVIPLFLYSFANQEYFGEAILGLISLLVTIVLFLIVVYVQAIRVEIPLTFTSVRGLTFKWPINFLYTSNIPVILVAAMFANVQLFGRVFASAGFPILGSFDESGYPKDGLVKYMSSPHSLIILLFTKSITLDHVITAIVYTLLMVAFATLFGYLWVQVSGMSAKDLAKQISNSNLARPGYRNDPRILERLLNRYIPYLTILGSMTVGLLAAISDIFGALVSGTGLLLSVMILYRFAQDLTRQYAEELPVIGKLLKG